VFHCLPGIRLSRRQLSEDGVGASAGHQRGINQSVRPRVRIEPLSRREQFGPFPRLQVNLRFRKVGVRFEWNLVCQQQRRFELFVASGGQGRVRQRIGLLLRLGSLTKKAAASACFPLCTSLSPSCRSAMKWGSAHAGSAMMVMRKRIGRIMGLESGDGMMESWQAVIG
jgi:hypothetical protein